MTMPTEAETCREYVIPRLRAAEWGTEPHAILEQRSFTDGRIVFVGNRTARLPKKRVDYLLRYTPDFPLAVVEAKRSYKLPSDGLQQAKDYAELLGLKFAYATNGQGIIEHDYTTGRETELQSFPTPDQLWARLRTGANLPTTAAQRLLAAAYQSGKPLRYYQEIAVHRALQAILTGQRRVLLTMATGTGKTDVAFQICWKLWNVAWNRTDRPGRPKILYLADRNFLIDDPKDKQFAPFEHARYKIEHGEISHGRELYFAIYQALAEDDRRPGLYREYARDFFDLIVVDECHRGSARDESTWRSILEYFEPAYQLGMTATPFNEESRNTYGYFGAPVYQYSLRQGMDDGFLAACRVHRVVTSYDALGWRPSQGDLDRFGREIPDDEYQTRDFERAVSLKLRTQAIAKHLTEHLKGTNRFAKTIVFCVDQEHADEMRRALNNLNADVVKEYPDYVVRITADEGEIGAGHLGRFQDPEKQTPAIVTTSQLLTTGVDVPTCQNVVFARVVGSMAEFKQIVGRGTRVREEYGKLFFDILDYTGTATEKFADPNFDGFPAIVTQSRMDDRGAIVPGSEAVLARDDPFEVAMEPLVLEGVAREDEPRKYYFDGGSVEILAHVVSEYDGGGRLLHVVDLVHYAAESIQGQYISVDALRQQWSDPAERAALVADLERRGIDLGLLAAKLERPDADPFDMLCHVAFSAPLMTRRDRAERLRRGQQDFLERYGPEARAVLEELIDKYAEHGASQLALPDILRLPPISDRGNPTEIADLFGGSPLLKNAVDELQRRLYAA